jgi:hypothetical protein
MNIGKCAAALLLLASSPAFSAQVETEDAAIKLALTAVHRYQLTPLTDESILLEVTESPTEFDVLMRERHSQRCGGDPETGPRLFNILVRKRDGRLSSDAYDMTTYQRVDRKPKPSR